MARQQAVWPDQRRRPVVGSRPARGVGGRPRQPRLGALGGAFRWQRVVLLVFLLAAMVLGGWWLSRSPLLSLQQVTVEGSARLSPEVVRSIADLEGRNLLHPDFEGARQRLLALPLVKEAHISREWPTGARITIVERAPWGVWQVGEARFVIDDDGVVLDVSAPESGFVIVQTDAAPPLAPGDRVDPGAVAVARQLVPTAERTLGRALLALEFSQASGLTAVLANGPDAPVLRATFGDAQGYDFKVATLYALLRRAEEEGRILSRVDLRFGDRVAVQ